MFKLANLTEISPIQFVTEASDLQWRNWPDQVPSDIDGGVTFFLFNYETDADNDVTAVIYKQVNGFITVKVFND